MTAKKIPGAILAPSNSTDVWSSGVWREEGDGGPLVSRSFSEVLKPGDRGGRSARDVKSVVRRFSRKHAGFFYSGMWEEFVQCSGPAPGPHLLLVAASC